MARNDVHTLPWSGDPRGWVNKREHQFRVRKIFRTQRDAILEGRRMARESKSEHFIHRRNGTIRMRNSYGNDPFPPRG